MLTWHDAFDAWAKDRPPAWIAYKIGVSVTSVYFYLHDGVYPYPRRRALIQRVSSGAVKADLPPRVIHKPSVKPNKSSRKGARRSGAS